MTSGSNITVSEDIKYTSHHYVDEASVMANNNSWNSMETTIQPEDECAGLEASIHVRLLIKILVSIFRINFYYITFRNTFVLCIT